MATTLTDTGWFGRTSGHWTTGADTVTDNIGGIVVNPGTTANTSSGNDSITGSGGVDPTPRPGFPPVSLYFGVENLGAILMGKGINSITGTASETDTSTSEFVFGIYNEIGSSITMNGNRNSITGTATGDATGLPVPFGIFGIYNRTGTITMGDGNNNSITGIGKATGTNPDPELGIEGYLAGGIFNRQDGIITMGNGNNNSIAGTGGYYNGIFNRGSITMGDGNNNSIIGTGVSINKAYGVYNQNFGIVRPDLGFDPSSITMGDGNNNSIIGTAEPGTKEGGGSIGIFNESGCTITMGDGNNNSIVGTAKGGGGIGIKNGGNYLDDPTLPNPTAIITMGNGKDSITGMGDGCGILNDGEIHLGGGNDSVIAYGGFGGSGSVFLEDGSDYLKGFGSGNFYGGTGRDILELTKGSYEVSRVSHGSSTEVNFTKTGTDITMHTSEFETLMAGNNRYDFSSLYDGQMITVA